MKTNKNVVFIALQIISWIIFIGLSIEAGALLVNFIISVFKPELIQNLYEKMDLSSVYNENKFIFYGMYSFALYISVLKAVMFYFVILLVQKIDLSQPFNRFVSEKISKISYMALSIGIISIIATQIGKNMMHHGYDFDRLSKYWSDSTGFILMAAVVYIIALIFKKGIELQEENDLTV
ncbi:conserved membrane hypothetical protein [Flavobacterium sp. 9AF]|uniref:DUF2975 domain-containing protein n=1 Tax=Flavobacterium sp. 9AF TaxID=2653142 RepID=UPI0012F3B70E|nr:DUF2975 domain-containing protein [Flavobacterium sp. 9AF]VXA92380.1 conserved membrane hypothetical protein [Flavobacterium sp. 9AF]